METMGVSSFTIKDLLEKRLTRSEIKNLLNGEFKVPGFSEETFEDNINKLNLEDPIQAAKLSSEIRSAIFSMDNLRKSLKFTNFRESRDELDKKINRILYPTIKLFREEPVGIETVEPKAELPTDKRAAIQPSGNVIAQTIKQPTLTELAKADTLGNRFNLLRTV